MKFTLSWLKDHLETTASLDDIATTLTALGLEVEEIVDRAKGLESFKVAYVKSCDQHPNADKLHVCMVDTGAETLQVVCGAPNARQGIKVVFAPVGSVVPATGDVLKKGVIRGVESGGMMCSMREMGLSEEHDGIIELPADAVIGTPFAEVLGLNDPLIDINLTPDRADCAGVRGVARDLAAAGLGTLKPLKAEPVKGTFQSPVSVTLADDVKETACPLFVGRLIRGVKNGPSPKWVQDKLTSVGLRPISALVDITNLLTMDMARPLHVFDADKLSGNLVVRMAKAGETLEALNDKTYTLADNMVVIADDSGALSLGGVMGGTSTGCTESTVNVFVESALFDAIQIAKTGRALDIVSDARYRFERGVDPESTRVGMEIATRLILELCGGEASDVVVAGAVPQTKRTLTLRPERCATLGGLDVPLAKQVEILTHLGFEVARQADGLLSAVPPSWRADVVGEADLVEEILRVIGFDAIPAVPFKKVTNITQPAITAAQRRPIVVRRALAGRGMEEAVTWSFTEHGVASLFGAVTPDMMLLNPISADLDALRPSILVNLLMAAGRNAARGYPDVSLFEVGPAFRSGKPEDQVLTAGGIRVGGKGPRHWQERRRPVDAYDAKADALAALEAAGAPVGNLQVTADAPSCYHPGRSGCLRLGTVALATFGEIHPSVLAAMKIDGPAVGFEVNLNALPPVKKKAGTAKPLVQLSPFQPISRDFAFVVDAGVESDKVVRAIRAADKVLIRDAAVFDVYVGAGVPDGKKSLALAVTVQPTERTLVDADLEALSTKIIAAVTKATGAVLRA